MRYLSTAPHYYITQCDLEFPGKTVVIYLSVCATWNPQAQASLCGSFTTVGAPDVNTR